MTKYTIQLLNQSDYAENLKDVLIFQRPSAGTSPGVEAIAWTNSPNQRPSGHDFAAESNYAFNINMPSNTSAPATNFQVQPLVASEVAPGVKLHVADGFGTEGESVEEKNVSGKAIETDSAGLAQTTATVVQAADGSFSVKFD